jgi:hypothetical protein
LPALDGATTLAGIADPYAAALDELLFSPRSVRAPCVSEETVKSAAGRVERALFFFRAAMNQRAAVSMDHLVQNLVHSQLSQGRVFREATGDLPAQYPQIVDVFLNGFGRQTGTHQGFQKGPEAGR